MVGRTGDAVARHPTGSMTAARSAPGNSLRSRSGPVNWQLRSDQRERHPSLWNTSLEGELSLPRQRLRALGRGRTGPVGAGLGGVRGVLLGPLRVRLLGLLRPRLLGLLRLGLLGLDGDRSAGAGGRSRLLGVGDRTGTRLGPDPGLVTLGLAGELGRGLLVPGRLGRGLLVPAPRALGRGLLPRGRLLIR